MKKSKSDVIMICLLALKDLYLNFQSMIISNLCLKSAHFSLQLVQLVVRYVRALIIPAYMTVLILMMIVESFVVQDNIRSQTDFWSVKIAILTVIHVKDLIRMSVLCVLIIKLS